MEVKLIHTLQYILLVKKEDCYHDSDIYHWSTKIDYLMYTNADFVDDTDDSLLLHRFEGFILGYWYKPMMNYENTFDLTPKLPPYGDKFPIGFIPEIELELHGDYTIDKIKTDSNNQLIGEWIYESPRIISTNQLIKDKVKVLPEKKPVVKNYSQNFERDYSFYLNNIQHFTFCGTMIPKFKAISEATGKTAKDVFYSIDSNGKNIPCREPELLDNLLLCKASVNFHIKQWAEGRVDGTLPYYELNGDGNSLEWEMDDDGNVVPVYDNSLSKKYGFPEWVIKAIEAQKIKLFNTN